MGNKKFSMGIDFGSNSVRALIIDIADGQEYGSASCVYPGGTNGIYTVSGNPHLARQNPDSYLEAMTEAVKKAVEKAKAKDSFRIQDIIGIGVDATASTPIPVTHEMIPLSRLEKFKGNLNAYAWMWKDHTSIEEAEKINELAQKIRPQYLEKCGGTYSSEWFFAKIWHCMNADREVFDNAYSWVELSDFIPAVLCGIKQPENIKRNICAAGHKCSYSDEWNGLPDKDFLSGLSCEFGNILPRLFTKAYSSDNMAGQLSCEWSKILGLEEGIAVAIGAIDAHLGAVGAGVGKNRLVKIIGTSSCDIMVSPSDRKIPAIPGVCGIAESSVIPGYYGIEAGQAAAGDIFNWFTSKICGGDNSIFEKLGAEAEKLRPGESGLLALDWHNGNRNIIADQKLTGLLVGMTLHTSQAEIYRALIEATAFGARKILDRLEEYNIRIEEIVCCGGIAEKNSLFMQIYADILNRPMRISDSSETCALGAAIYGAVAGGGYEKVEDAQKAICSFKDKVYIPKVENTFIYDRLYCLYSELHDSFGIKGMTFDHANIMKALLEMGKSLLI